MATVTVKTILDADINKVWNTITSLEEYTWRTDVSKIEVVEPNRKFIEYTKDGYQTEFVITNFKPVERYEFIMSNDNMEGSWIGKMKSIGNKTQVEFIENVKAKKIFLKPFVKSYLKKQQATYIKDLRKYLTEMK